MTESLLNIGRSSNWDNIIHRQIQRITKTRRAEFSNSLDSPFALSFAYRKMHTPSVIGHIGIWITTASIKSIGVRSSVCFLPLLG